MERFDRSDDRNVSPEFAPDIVARYADNPWDYLNHQTYGKYQRMHKMHPGRRGAQQLEVIAEMLSGETDPRFLTAAASAFVESAIVRHDDEREARLTLIDKAQVTWENALATTDQLQRSHPEIVEYTDSYRIGMNLACLPMVRGMVEGNVKTEVIQNSVKQLLQIADLSTIQLHLATKIGNGEAVSQHSGMQYEINALVSLLLQADPKYIAIPSSDRAGSGYYYQDQTHDITLISQHYGQVRSVIPVEVKAAASKRDRERYRALIVRGKMHLALPHLHKAEFTKDAFERYLYGEPTVEDIEHVETINRTVGTLLAHYKQGGKYAPLRRKTSKTHYYNPTHVRPYYTAA